MAIYENKYKLEFDDFEKQVQKSKKENFDIWDDYIVWQALNTAYQKWQKRYFSL